MSFWTKFTDDLSRGVQSLQNQVTSVFQYPTEAMCPCCSTLNGVPPATFNWNCLNGHTNMPDATNCYHCHYTKSDTQSRGLYLPRVTCYKCSRGFDVSTTKGANWCSQQVQTAPQQAQQLVDDVTNSVKVLSSQPQTFHCTHCQTLLQMPTGPWQCSLCHTHNPAGTSNCTNTAGRCNHSRYNELITCTVCHNSTSIPLYKITDQLKAFGHQVTATTKQGYFHYWSQEPHCICPTCHVPTLLTEEEYKLLFPEESQGEDFSYHPPQHPTTSQQSQSGQFQPQPQYKPMDPDAAAQSSDPYASPQHNPYQQQSTPQDKPLEEAPPSYLQASAPSPNDVPPVAPAASPHQAPPVQVQPARPVEGQPVIGPDGKTYRTILVTCSGCKMAHSVTKMNVFGKDKKPKKVDPQQQQQHQQQQQQQHHQQQQQPQGGQQAPPIQPHLNPQQQPHQPQPYQSQPHQQQQQYQPQPYQPQPYQHQDPYPSQSPYQGQQPYQQQPQPTATATTTTTTSTSASPYSGREEQENLLGASPNPYY